MVTKVSANDYFKALEFFNKKKTEESLIYFKKVAEDENHEKRSDAMFNIALIYDNGLGIQVDKTRALYYYKAASDLSNKFALFNLVWIYYNGENVNKISKIVIKNLFKKKINIFCLKKTLGAFLIKTFPNLK